jgi:hypothetical protein
VSDKALTRSRLLKKEAALLLVMLFFGIVLLPIAIWVVGDFVFGAYGGSGYGDFFSSLSGKLRSGNGVAWFLVFSPWLALQVVRLALVAWRYAGKV